VILKVFSQLMTGVGRGSCLIVVRGARCGIGVIGRDSEQVGGSGPVFEARLYHCPRLKLARNLSFAFSTDWKDSDLQARQTHLMTLWSDSFVFFGGSEEIRCVI
jgi:hypothetical protein